MYCETIDGGGTRPRSMRWGAFMLNQLGWAAALFGLHSRHHGSPGRRRDRGRFLRRSDGATGASSATFVLGDVPRATVAEIFVADDGESSDLHGARSHLGNAPPNTSAPITEISSAALRVSATEVSQVPLETVLRSPDGSRAPPASRRSSIFDVSVSDALATLGERVETLHADSGRLDRSTQALEGCSASELFPDAAESDPLKPWPAHSASASIANDAVVVTDGRSRAARSAASDAYEGLVAGAPRETRSGHDRVPAMPFLGGTC